MLATSSLNAQSFTTELSTEQIAQFERDGFIVPPALSDAAEVLAIRHELEYLFAENTGRNEGAQYDLVSRDEEGATASLPQLIDPMNYTAQLRHTLFLQNALAIARQLLGPAATFANDHAILKPALHGKATPWHQDEAYRVDGTLDYQELSFWMALQNTTIESGCMHYIAESHRGGVLTHRSVNDDPQIHALECCDIFDMNKAVACPVPAGGVIIHHGRTLHYAGANQTSNDRYAYVLIFEAPPKRTATTRIHHWNIGKETARMQRFRRWSNHGGIIDVIKRKTLRLLRDPKRYYFKFKSRLARPPN